MWEKPLPKIRLLVCLLLGLWFSVCLAGNMEQNRDAVIALIKSGQIESAKSSVDKLITDNPQDPNLPEALSQIARNYEWSDKWPEAKNVFGMIVQKYSKSAAAEKARLGFSRTNICLLISSGQMQTAKTEVDKMTADFAGNPDLSDTLFWVARRYEWTDRFEDAKNVFQQIVQQYPKSAQVSNARFGILRMNICSFILSGQMKEAKAEVEKMTSGFAGNSDLPDTLYWIGKRYGWAENNEEAKNVFQQIIQNYPDTESAGKAKMDFARANVVSLITSQDYSGAKTALDKLIADFKNHPDFLDALYWIGRKYEWTYHFEEARSIYQQIIQNYPNSSFANKAKLDFARAGVLSLIMSEKYDQAEEALNKMIADFKDHPSLPNAVFSAAERYHLNALKPDTKPEASNKLYRITEDLLEKYALGKIVDRVHESEAYYLAALTCDKLGDWKKAADFGQKLLQVNPKYEHAGYCQFIQGYSYEKLMDNKLISETQAMPIITSNYKKLLADYPQSKYASHAIEWLKNNQ